MPLSAIAYPDPLQSTPTGLVIVLHGWGANAMDLAGLAPVLQLTNYQFLFPDAPFPHPEVPGGRMWYNLYELPNPSELEASRQQLQEWLQSLESSTGVPLQRTILAGFSQGGAMTLDVGTHLPLAGLVCLSGYLHPPEIRQLPQTAMPPIFIGHGRQDLVVSVLQAQRARDLLTQAGTTVKYHEYDMGHEISPDILMAARTFIEQIMR